MENPIKNAVESNEDYKDWRAIDFWKNLVVDVRSEMLDELASRLFESMKAEKVGMVSGIMERSCNLKCAHCLYNKDHKTSRQVSDSTHLTDVIANIVAQLPIEQELNDSAPASPDEGRIKPAFLHEGRILRKSHLEVFERIRAERPDVVIGLIDNGSYVKYLGDFMERGIKLDWVDISIDGTEQSHNLQRDPEMKKAYGIAIEGLRHAREITKSTDQGGKVSSLFTITKLNFEDILQTGTTLLQERSGELENSQPLVDEFHLTTMGPVLPENFPIEISAEDMKIVWDQIKKLCLSRTEIGEKDVFFRIYLHEDIEKLAKAVGEKMFWDAVTNKGNIDVGKGDIRFILDGVQVIYYPASLFPLETILIDSDSAYRSARAQQFSLDELERGVSKYGVDLDRYTWDQLSPKSSLSESYEKGVSKWSETFGKEYLREELATFERIKQKALGM